MSTTVADSIAGVVIFDPSFVREDFVDIIRNNSWPE
jgi:hypothetical protein